MSFERSLSERVLPASEKSFNLAITPAYHHRYIFCFLFLSFLCLVFRARVFSFVFSFSLSFCLCLLRRGGERFFLSFLFFVFESLFFKILIPDAAVRRHTGQRHGGRTAGRGTSFYQQK